MLKALPIRELIVGYLLAGLAAGLYRYSQADADSDGTVTVEEWDAQAADEGLAMKLFAPIMGIVKQLLIVARLVVKPE